MIKSLRNREAAAQEALEAATENARKAQIAGGEGGAAQTGLARALGLADEWATSGVVLFVTVDAEVAAVLLMADSLKPEAKGMVDALKSLGVRPVLLTGDKMSSARMVAQAGVPERAGAVSPCATVALAGA